MYLFYDYLVPHVMKKQILNKIIYFTLVKYIYGVTEFHNLKFD